MLLNEEKPEAAAQKLAAEAKAPAFEPGDVHGISKGTRHSEDTLTETKITVQGNRCTYEWTHNSGHFTTIVWQKGPGPRGIRARPRRPRRRLPPETCRRRQGKGLSRRTALAHRSANQSPGLPLKATVSWQHIVETVILIISCLQNSCSYIYGELISPLACTLVVNPTFATEE
ncbi:MAG: hypothetical protein WDN28_14865 [Chthoniobacter sp.]